MIVYWFNAGCCLHRVADNNDRMTEARAYIGMYLLLDGKRQEAVEHFRWVQASGRKTYLQYRLALAELKRLKI
jgi:lipoprotein NlpI